MATKELAFTSKINSLNDYLRQIVSFSQPPLHGSDVANTIRYFVTTLLNILKDAPNIKGEKFYGARYAKSNVRLALFPTLNYSGLFESISGLLPVAHLVVVNQEALMDNLLQLIACIVPFLTWDQLTQLPYKVALMLPMSQPSQYADIVQLLCTNLLPNTLGVNVGNNIMVTEAVAGMLMIILQYCTDPRLHSMFVESLLPLRDHLYKDIFTVIAYGPPNTKIPAVSLLFYYWPQLQFLLTSNNISLGTYTHRPWLVPKCQRTHCINKIARSTAKKMCTHPNMCSAECVLPPPAFICVDCYDTHGMRLYDDSFIDIVLPAEKISVTCDNKACLNPGTKAFAVCTSPECVKMNRFRPISLCYACNLSRHPGNCGHVQQSIANIWSLDLETQSYIVDAIVNLLREAEPEAEHAADVSLHSFTDSASVDFLVPKVAANSRYGILLLKELCDPVNELNVNALGRLLAMLFQWFQCTATTGDEVENALVEKMKTELMTAWVHNVKKTHYEIILSTLLPHPPDFAKVGGNWEKLSGRTEQMKEGLGKLIILGPYDIVSSEVWDYIMPYWLESIRTELTAKEREEIKVPLKQVFDIEMSPLPFLLDNILNFIQLRFKSNDQQIQEQGLQWLQILTSVDIAIPVLILLTMFKDGVQNLLTSVDQPPSADPSSSTDQPPPAANSADVEVKLNCFILMLDIFLKQCELSKVTPHGGVTQNKSVQIFPMLVNMIQCIRPLVHPTSCNGKESCTSCQKLIVFYQLVFNLIRILCPKLESSLPVLDVGKLEEITRGSEEAKRKEGKMKSSDSAESAGRLEDVAEAGDGTPQSKKKMEKREDSGDSPSPLHSLFVCLLQVLEKHTDTDICFYVVHSLKSLFVHGQSLNLIHKTHPESIEAFLEQQFVPRLWKMLDSRQSRTSKLAVNMLFHAIALGNGHVYFWAIVNGECIHDNWQVRYGAVDKIRMIWESSSANFLSKNQAVMTSLAHVFCQYVTLLHDPDHNVAQRALMQLELLGEVALQAIMKCMSVQFDMVVKDRQLILYKLSQLQNAIPRRHVFSWSFFLARLQQLFVEAELHESNGSETSGSRGSILKVSTGQNLDQMVKIARFASMRCNSVHSIREHSGVYDKGGGSLASSITTPTRDKMPGGAFLKYKGKKKSASHSDGSLQDWLLLAHESLQDLSYLQHMLARSRKVDEVMPEFGSESAKIIKTLWRSMESEKLDPSVLHLLTSLVVKYMSSPLTNEPQDEHNSKQAATIEHLFYLLGYAEGRFFVKPSQLRSSPTFDALLVNLPKLLDGNVELGSRYLHDYLNILKCCGSPQKYASDSQTPDYTLVHLPPSLTKYWLQSFLIILYKYHSRNNVELSPTISYLLHIVLNTLAAIPHSCKRKGSDGDSVKEVQGVIQGAGDQEQTSRKTDEEAGAQTSCLERLGATTSLPGAPGLLIASSIIREEDEFDSSTRSRGSTLDRSDPAVKTSRARAVASASRSSFSPGTLKKSQTHDGGKSTKKNKKVQRQDHIESGSPSKAKLSHWQAVDLPKPDDFASFLMNPQQKAAAPTAASAVELLSDKTVSKGESSPSTSKASKSASPAEVSIELKKTDTSRKFGGVLSKVGKRQNSRSNMLESMGVSTDEEQQSAIIQSAAASDFMGRSKRGHTHIPKQDSNDSTDVTKHGGGMLTASDSVRRVHCPECSLPMDSYTEETIVLCIVTAETYLVHDLNQAASMVYDMILSISRIANSLLYTWQSPERPVFIPGNVVSSALQFIRCTLHQLNTYGIMAALLTSAHDSQMFKTIVTALTDFHELSSQQALLTALERINEKSEIKMLPLIENLNEYLSAITVDLAPCQVWPKIVDQLEALFRKLTSHLPEQSSDLTELLTLMSTIFKLPIVTTHKGDRLVETYGKLLSAALPSHTFNLIQLAKLCQLCKATFSKDREKTILARMVVNELIQVLKYKSTLPEANVLILLEIVCMDCGSTLLPTYITNEIPSQLTSDMLIDAGIADVMKLFLNDAMEFICDLHTLLKLKAHMKSTCLHEDTFGGVLKTGVAQILALEMSILLRNDGKANLKVIPWLYNQPSIVQRGLKEFTDSVDHIRFLCWLHIGALTHHAVAENVLKVKCQPLSLDDVGHICQMVISVMTGFVEYNPSSVECMSSLNYAFIFCQVYTIYCETLTMEGIEREPEVPMDISQIIYFFWSKVTPTILNMMLHNRVLTELVNLHILSLMETLQECQSSVAINMFPIWRTHFYAHDNKLAANILVRLRALENHKPPIKRKFNKAILFDWIKKVQFKLAQIEVQSSTAVQFLNI